MLGTDDLYTYLEKYQIELDPEYDGLLGRHAKRSWSKFVTTDNQALVSNEAIDLLDKLVSWSTRRKVRSLLRVADEEIGVSRSCNTTTPRA